MGFKSVFYAAYRSLVRRVGPCATGLWIRAGPGLVLIIFDHREEKIHYTGSLKFILL